MNKTVIKDILKEIKSNKSRFFSILALLFISMVAFSGVFMSTFLLADTPEKYYKETNMHDVLITSTLGLSNQDIYILENNELVEDFEMSKSVDVIDADREEIVRVESLPQKITKAILVSGKLPKETSEIALSYEQFNGKIELGDIISFVDGNKSGDITGLKRSDFKVVGFVNSVEYISQISRQFSTIGSGTVWSYGYVVDDVFDMDYYTKAKLKAKGLNIYKSSDKKYALGVDYLIRSLENSFENRPKMRLEEFKEELNKEIAKAETKLRDAKKKLADGEKELDKGKTELLKAEVDIRQGELDLLNGRKKIEDGWSDYDKGIVELEKGEREGREKLLDAKKKLDQSKIELENGKKKLKDGRAELEKGRIELEDGKKKFKEGEDLYNLNLEKYQDGIKKLNEEKEKIRISKEIKYGNISEAKSKDELEKTISSLTVALENHNVNLENYTAQLQYNEELLRTSDDKIEIEEKIKELKALIENENQAINMKNEKLKLAKEALANFNKVKKEGPVSDDVINYSDEAIEAAEKELSAGKTKLDEAKSELEKNRQKLNEAIADFEKGEKEILENEQKLKDGEVKYKQGLVDYEEGKKAFEDEIVTGRKKLADAKKKLEDGEKELVEAASKLEKGQKDYEEGLKKYNEGLDKYEEETVDAKKKIEDGEIKLADAKNAFSKLREADFMIDSRNADTIYYTVAGFPGSLKILAAVFSLLALLISLLVASTTMTRMVDERRILIGTFKGLGYENIVIAAKFLIFGGLSGITGTIVGTIVGQKVLAPVIYHIYMDGMIFREPIEETSFLLIIVGLILAIITTTISAYLAVNKTLKENTASLLRPKAPKMGSRILLEKNKFIWNKMSFMNKITARNIFRYKGRMAMTIIGVAVCMAMMILGFGMKNSIANVANLQFGQLQKYDLTLTFSDNLKTEVDRHKIEKIIFSNKNVEKVVFMDLHQLKLQIKGKNTQDVNLVVDSENKLSNIINFRKNSSNEILKLANDGVLITEKIAKLMNLEIGDDFVLIIDGKEVKVKVSGMVENYLGHFVYISKDYYQEVTGKSPVISGAFVSLFEKDIKSVDKASTEILKNEDIMSSISSRNTEQIMKNTLESIDVVIIIIVLIAMLLALVVLYNLTNINVSERVRELSTMKVLGFYPKELTEYVYKETFFLSIIGIIFGMGLGALIVEFVLAKFAPLNIMFGNPGYGSAFLISSIFTFIFTLIVMVLMHFKLKSIDMIEALKSVD